MFACGLLYLIRQRQHCFSYQTKIICCKGTKSDIILIIVFRFRKEENCSFLISILDFNSFLTVKFEVHFIRINIADRITYLFLIIKKFIRTLWLNVFCIINSLHWCILYWRELFKTGIRLQIIMLYCHVQIYYCSNYWNVFGTFLILVTLRTYENTSEMDVLILKSHMNDFWFL